MTQIKSLGVLLVVFASLFVTIPVWAHHSNAAEFDASKEFTVRGTLTRVEWENPHVYFYVDVKDNTGKVVTYAFEGHPPSTFHRAGVTKDKFIIGQDVTVLAAPAKDGSKHLGYGKKVHYNSDGHDIYLWVTGLALPVN